MSNYELRINVYDGSKIGHTNVSFYEDGEHVYTLGANIRVEGPLLAVPQIGPFEFDDGIYRDETAYHAQAIETGMATSAAVPVTDMQYDSLLSAAHALEGRTFNYSVFTEACIELVEDFYDATGHPGEFGDLFAAEDRSGPLVWSRVPVTYDSLISTWPDDRPLYSPPEPFMPDPPTPPAPTIFAGMPDPPDFLIDEKGAGGNTQALGGIVNQIGSPDSDPGQAVTGLPANSDDWGSSPDEIPVPEGLDSDEKPADASPQGVEEVVETPEDALTSPGLALENTVEDEAVTDPLLSKTNAPVLSFPISTTDDDDPGQSSGSGSFSADAAEPKEFGPNGTERASPVFNSGMSFDLSADDFDFSDAVSSTDLSFGNDSDGSDLIDALSTPREDLSFSFESPSLDEDTDQASYDHTYDEFGIFI